MAPKVPLRPVGSGGDFGDDPQGSQSPRLGGGDRVQLGGVSGGRDGEDPGQLPAGPGQEWPRSDLRFQCQGAPEMAFGLFIPAEDPVETADVVVDRSPSAGEWSHAHGGRHLGGQGVNEGFGVFRDAENRARMGQECCRCEPVGAPGVAAEPHLHETVEILPGEVLLACQCRAQGRTGAEAGDVLEVGRSGQRGQGDRPVIAGDGRMSMEPTQPRAMNRPVATAAPPTRPLVEGYGDVRVALLARCQPQSLTIVDDRLRRAAPSRG